jgi:hypothetical protein
MKPLRCVGPIGGVFGLLQVANAPGAALICEAREQNILDEIAPRVAVGSGVENIPLRQKQKPVVRAGGLSSNGLDCYYVP